jgi:hypothetical protein
VRLVARVVAVTVLLAALAACSGSEPEEPTFDVATKTLIDDATKLMGTAEVKVSGHFRVTERAEGNSTNDCVPGEVQRFYRAEGDFVDAQRQSPFNAAGLIGSRLGLDDYDRVVDHLDLMDDELAVEVRRKPESGVTFVIAARTTKPNIRIVGKTDCFKPA